MAGNESVYSVGPDEFNPPTNMQQFYCDHLTQEEYEDQAAIETERAIKDLIGSLENDPSAYIRLLKKRKQEQLENSGIFTYLKAFELASLRRGPPSVKAMFFLMQKRQHPVKILQHVQGSDYSCDEVDSDEVQTHMDELKTGMLMAYDYAQECKGRRFSRRLAMKRQRSRKLNDENAPPNSPGMKSPLRSPAVKSPRKKVPAPPPPPPCPPPPLPFSASMVPPLPPPCPPPPITPFRNRNNLMHSTPFTPKTKNLERTDSTSSLASIHLQLISSNPMARLRSVKDLDRSPGGARALTRRPIHGSSDALNGSYHNPLDSSEPLSRAFLRIMEQKFRNVRSPSPRIDSPSMNSPSMLNESGFTP